MAVTLVDKMVVEMDYLTVVEWVMMTVDKKDEMKVAHLEFLKELLMVLKWVAMLAFEKVDMTAVEKVATKARMTAEKMVSRKDVRKAVVLVVMMVDKLVEMKV